MRYAMLIVTGLLAACNGDASAERAAVKVSGAGSTRTFDARDFDRVELAGPDDVEVRTGGQFSVRAEGDPTALAEVEVLNRGGKLVIRRKKSDKWNWGSRGAGVRVLVSMPAIRGGSVAGSGDLTIDRAENGFDGAIAGSGDLTLGVLQGGDARFAIAGSGTIATSGQANDLRVEIAGSGDVKAEGLQATSADISIAGSGGVKAQVRGPAKVALLGAGDVDLGTAARCSVSKMGSGEARCGS